MLIDYNINIYDSGIRKIYEQITYYLVIFI